MSREVHGLRVFQSEVLRKIFGLKRNEVTIGWRKPCNEELLALIVKYNYNEVKKDDLCRGCSMNGAKRNAYRILVGKPEAKRPLGRPRCRWVDNIKMDLREIGWGGIY
jgi:hypothetical protein